MSLDIKKVEGPRQCEFFYKNQLIYGVYDTEFCVEGIAFIRGKMMIVEIRCQWLGGGIAEAEEYQLEKLVKLLEAVR